MEFCEPEIILEREQYWLDWLFSLPASQRYNFLSKAGSLWDILIPRKQKLK